MTIEASVLFVADTASRIYAAWLQLAAAAGLPTTSWRAGDPTRTLGTYLARAIAAREDYVSNLARGNWLSTAVGDWLKTRASEQYGVDFTPATYAEPTVTVTNTGGGYFTPRAGELTFKCTATGATFHNTDAGTDTTTNAPGPLSAGKTLRYALTADVPGSSGTVTVNEIDALVTSLLKVVVVSSTAALGLDEQADDAIKTQCLATLGALSPNGPGDAYEFVARNPALTGAQDITRARAIDNTTTGAVLTYVAGASGPVAGASLTAALAAIVQWAKPLCHTPTVAQGTAVAINVAATFTGSVGAGFLAAAQAEVLQRLSNFNIAGASGDSVDHTLISTAIRDVVPGIGVLTMTSPAAPTALAQGQYPTLGTFSLVQV